MIPRDGGSDAAAVEVGRRGDWRGDLAAPPIPVFVRVPALTKSVVGLSFDIGGALEVDMASTFSATSTVGLMAALTGKNVRLQRRANFRVKAAKELYFNKDASAIKKLQTRVSKLADQV